MPAYSTAGALPIEELSVAIVEGENAVQGLVGDQVLGDLGITWRNAHIVKATLADTLGLRHIAADKYIHAPGTKFERLTATFGDADVTVTPRGVELAIPFEMTKDYANRFDVQAFFAGRFGSQVSALTKEKLIADAVFNTTNLGSATNSTVAYTAALLTTNSFIGDIIAACRRGRAKGEIYDTVVMSGPVFERVRQAATVQAFTVGSLNPGAQATQSTVLASLAEFGIKKLLVGEGYYNNAADGATPSLSQIWSNTYIAVVKAGMQPSASATEGVGVPTIAGIGALVFWEGFSPGGAPSADRNSLSMEGGNYVEEYPSLETNSNILRIQMSHKPYILNARAGELIATQYS
jgi:hypothetical protein